MLRKSGAFYNQNFIKISCNGAYINKRNVNTQLDKNDDVSEDNQSLPASTGKVNKSRLHENHRRMLHGETPYDEPHSWIHLTEKYQRKMFGRYGSQSSVNPSICFPTKEDLAKTSKMESIAYPHTLPELISKVHANRAEEKEKLKKREKEIEKKLEKLEQWKSDLKAKIIKKETAALAAKERKERLVEEVRRHFGFNVDPRDERFKEMLEKKEKEDNKKLKEAKRKAKEEKMLAKLIEKNA